MRSSRKLASAVSVAVSMVVVGMVTTGGEARGQTFIDRNSAVANLNTVGAWTGGVVPGVGAVARFGAGAALTNTMGANLTFGGLSVTSPAGGVSITGNTLTLERFGLDMSAATQDLTVSSAFGLSGGVKQTWNVAAGRTATFTGAMLASNASAGSVLLSGGGAVVFTNANVTANALLGAGSGNLNGNFVINGGRDFVGANASKIAVAGQTAAPASYGTNPATGTDAPIGGTVPTAFNFVNFNDNAVTGWKVPNANSFPSGWLFNTPVAGVNPLNRDWIIDATDAGGINRQIGGGALGILMGPDADTNVQFIYSGTGGQAGTGFRLGNRLAFWHMRNYNLTKEVTIGVQISQAGGGGINSTLVKSGPGRVNLNNSVFLNSTGGVIVQEGTLQLMSSGSISSSTPATPGTITVNGGSLILNNGTSTAIGLPIVVNTGASLGGTGTAQGAVTLNSGASYSAGNAGISSGVGTQTFGTLSVSGGVALRYDFLDATTHDQVTVTASAGLSLGTGGVNSIPVSLFDSLGNAFSELGTYTLFRLTGGLGGSGLATNLFVANADPSKVYTFGSSTTALTLSISASAPEPIYWNVDASGNWGVNGNWTANFPDGAGRIASFGGGSVTFTGARTVSLDANRTVGQVNLVADQSFTIDAPGGQTLSLDNSGTSAVVTVSGAAHTISAPMTLTSDAGALFNVASSLSVSGVVGGSGPVTKSGVGQLTFSADGNTLGALSVGGGIMTISGTGNTAGNVTVTGGTLVISKPGNTFGNALVTAGTLQIGDGVTDGSLPGGTITVGSAGTMEFVRASPVTYNTTYTGITGVLSFAGTGVATLFGPQAPSGTIRINGATVVAAGSDVIAGGSAVTAAPEERYIGGVAGQPLVMNAGTLDMNGNAIFAGAISGSGSITDTSTGTGISTLIYNSGADTTFSGNITDGGTRQLAVVKVSPNTANTIGVWTLTGTNNFSGGLSVFKGDLIGAPAALGEGDFTVWAAGTNASARARLGIAGSGTLDNNITVVGINTNTSGAIFVVNPNDNVTLTGSLKQNSGPIGAGTSAGGTVQGPNGTGLLTLAGPLLASDDGLSYPFVFNAAAQGNIRFSYPGGGLTNSSSGQYIVNQGNISLGADDGIAPGAELRLGSLGSGQTTFDLRGYNQTLRQLTRGGGSGSVTVTNSSATASTLTINPDAEITFPGNIGGNLNLTNAGSNTVALTGNTTFTGNLSVTGTDGRVTLQNTHRPVTGSLNVTGDRASVQLTANRGVNFTVVGEYNGINIGATGTVTVPVTTRSTSAATGVLVANTVSIAAGGFLDLGNNDLIVKAGSESAVRALVAAWYNGGVPALTGIGSSATLPTSTTFGVVSNSKFGFADRATFDGVSIDASAVIVKYTWQGDTNLDGVLDALDVNAVLNGWSNGLTGWANGDIDYNGVVDGADYGLLVAALGNYTGPLGDGIDPGTSGGVIPEPAALGLLLPALVLGGRRRRS